MGTIATVALGLWPRQGLAKVRAKSEAQESHFILPGMQKSVKEWALTLPNELPHWELDSRWTPKFSEADCRGQNSLDWKVLYIIRKLLERRCLNEFAWSIWVFKIYVMAKRRVGNQNATLGIALIYLCVGVMPHTVAKMLMRNTTLLSISSRSKFFERSYGPPKLRESQFRKFRDSNLGVLGQNDIWVLAPWPSIKKHYKREGGGFLQVRAMVSLMSLCLLVVRSCTKSAPTIH